VESTLFIIWFGATAVDAVGCALVIWPLYRLNTRFGRFLAVCLAGVAVESVVASVSLMLFWPDEVQVATAFALSRAAGRTVKAVCVWALCLYLMNFCARARKDGR
jgi:hypothetical protein